MGWSVLGVVTAVDLLCTTLMWLALFVWAGVRKPHYLEVDLACNGVIGWTVVFQAITIIIDLILALIILLT